MHKFSPGTIPNPYQWKNTIKINIFFRQKSHVYMCWALNRLSGYVWKVNIFFSTFHIYLFQNSSFCFWKRNSLFQNILLKKSIFMWFPNIYPKCIKHIFLDFIVCNIVISLMDRPILFLAAINGMTYYLDIGINSVPLQSWMGWY